MSFKLNKSKSIHKHLQNLHIKILRKLNFSRLLSSNNWDFIDTLEKYEKDLSEGKFKDEHFLISVDQMDFPIENVEATMSNADESLTSNNPPDETIQAVLPPMPIQVKVDTLYDDNVAHSEEVPLDLTPLSVSGQSAQPINTLKQASNDVHKPIIQVKVEEIPDTNPNIFVKTENIISEPVKQTRPVKVKPFNIPGKSNLLKTPTWLTAPPSTALTVRNDSLTTGNTDNNVSRTEESRTIEKENNRGTLIIRNDLIDERRPLTIRNEAVPKAKQYENEDDISTDEETDPTKIQPSNVGRTLILDDFYMENVAVLPKPGIIKSEILEDLQPETSLPISGIIKTEVLPNSSQESSEPEPKKIKVEEIPMVKREAHEWPLPLQEEKRDN